MDLTTGTILSLPEENGFTIDGAAHGEAKLGNWIKVRINGDEETLRTSCSLPITVHKPAGLWTVMGKEQLVRRVSSSPLIRTLIQFPSFASP